MQIISLIGFSRNIKLQHYLIKKGSEVVAMVAI
jgi:hypothetical protein